MSSTQQRARKAVARDETKPEGSAPVVVVLVATLLSSVVAPVGGATPRSMSPVLQASIGPTELVALGLVALLLLGFLRWRRWHADPEWRDDDLAPVVFPPDAGGGSASRPVGPPVAKKAAGPEPSQSRSRTLPPTGRGRPPAGQAPGVRSVKAQGGLRPTERPAAPAVRANSPAPRSSGGRRVEPEGSPGVRFEAPDGTLQLLPGRLQVLVGNQRGDEIRFVRLRDGTGDVTFGRAPGPRHHHVQLLEPTVSRRHARMRFIDGYWRVMNLSHTNPVTVNGHPLDGVNMEYVLRDGDQIEMGEVIFRFRAR